MTLDDTQELKEFVLERTISVEPILTEVLEDYSYLNECCENKVSPPSSINISA